MLLKFPAFIALIVLLSACASITPQPDQFKVNISAIQMTESTLMEQRFAVKLRIMNRGRDSVSIDGMSFDIELNGKDFASGVSNEKITIEPFSEGVLSVSVTSTIFGILRQLHGLQQNKNQPFNYEISGSIYPANSFLNIPFKEKGEIDFKTPSRQSSKNI